MVGSFKYLSVTVLSDLSWTQHIRNTTKAVKQQSGTLHWKLNQATPPARLTIYIYKSSILPKLDYYASVWDPHQKSLIEDAEKNSEICCEGNFQMMEL